MTKIFLLLVLLVASSAEANVYWVNPAASGSHCVNSATDPGSGSSSQTISGALGCVASAGGAPHTVNVLTGTYSEYIGWNGTNVPNGTSNIARVTLQGAPGQSQASVILRSPRSQANNISPLELYGFANYITFNNFTVDCEAWVIVNCVKIDQSSNINVTNMVIKNAAAGNCLLVHSQGGLISGNTIFNCDFPTITGYAYAIYLQGSNIQVDHNQLYNVSGYGVHGYLQNLEPAWDIGWPSNNTIFDNIIHDFGAGYSESAGILLARGTNNRAWNNIVYNGIYGIAIANCASGCTGAQAYSNTVYNMATACLRTDGTSSGAVFRNNICSNTTATPVSDGGSGSTFSNSLCSSSCIGSNNPPTESAATTFISPGSDFHLKAGSRAIGSGADLSATFTVDYANTPRTSPWDIGAYKYGGAVITTPPQLVLALPLDEGTGSTAVDVSGQNNNALRVGGASWDNAGKYGKAIMFDGSGSLNVPYTPSLALAPAMTLEAWIYPTAASSGFTTAIRQDRYFLYGSSDPGYCSALAGAPLGGYYTSANNFTCATSMPPLNAWSHVAVTYDGITTTFYLNGNVVASQNSTDPMVPSTGNVTIGASQFGENFVGKIDEVRVYNYSRTPPQILNDMNTPLIGVPGKVVEIAAPASVEISSASSLEISAD
jgi:hypothetical protein